LSVLTQTTAVDTIRLDDKSLAALYSNLDKRCTCLKRTSSGYRTKPIKGVLGIASSDDQLIPYSVYVRSIETHSCIILIGVYVRPHQEITLTIPTAAGEMQFFMGSTDECVLVMGKYHEARLSINTKIETLEFIGGGPAASPAADQPPETQADVPKCLDGLDEIETMLEALSSLGTGDSNNATLKLLEFIQDQAIRCEFDEVFEAAQQLLGRSDNTCPDPSALATLDSAIQSLRSG